MMMVRFKLADHWVMTHSLVLADPTLKDSQGTYLVAFLTGRCEINQVLCKERAIHWIAMYPVDSIIQPSNNRCLKINMVWPHLWYESSKAS